jgi:hypothetical protein
MKISATNTKAGNRSITVDYDKIFEKTETMTATEALEKNRQMFGDEVVNSVFVDGAVIWIQARLRNWLGQGIVANKKVRLILRTNCPTRKSRRKSTSWLLEFLRPVELTLSRRSSPRRPTCLRTNSWKLSSSSKPKLRLCRKTTKRRWNNPKLVGA